MVYPNLGVLKISFEGFVCSDKATVGFVARDEKARPLWAFSSCATYIGRANRCLGRVRDILFTPINNLSSFFFFCSISSWMAQNKILKIVYIKERKMLDVSRAMPHKYSFMPFNSWYHEKKIIIYSYGRYNPCLHGQAFEVWSFN